MSIINELAHALGRRDEEPNKQLAARIIATDDKQAIKELVAHLTAGNKAMQSDCIKTLYEIAESRPNLVAAYAGDFISLLHHKDNRMVWGGMTALSAITKEVPDKIFHALPEVMNAANKGSVIAKDHAVKILCTLGAIKQYTDDATELLLELLHNSAVNQLPTYAESIAAIINPENKVRLLAIIRERLPDVKTGSKAKRLEKLVKKMESSK